VRITWLPWTRLRATLRPSSDPFSRPLQPRPTTRPPIEEETMVDEAEHKERDLKQLGMTRVKVEIGLAFEVVLSIEEVR